MIRFEKKNLAGHLALAFLFSLVACVGVEMVLNYLHLTLLPVSGPVLRHIIHILLCFLVIGGAVLAYHLFPAFRNFWAAVDYHLLDQETRHKAVDWIYAVAAGLLLSHHFYVLLYYPILGAGAQKLTPVWLAFAAISIFLGKLWRRKEIWALSAFLVLIFERVYIPFPDLPDNTVIVLSTAIYAFFIAYAAFLVIRPSFRKPSLTVFCAVWTVLLAVLGAVGVYLTWTGSRILNLVGAAFERNENGRLILFSNPNITGGTFCVGVLTALLCFCLAKKKWLKGLCLVSVLPMVAATCLSGTRAASVAVSFAVAVLACLALSKALRGKKCKLPVLAVCFLGIFLALTLFQFRFNNLFNALYTRGGIIVPRAYAESESPYMQERGELDFSSADDFLSGRLSIWGTGFRYMGQHLPMLIYGDSVLNPGLQETGMNHYHNMFLQIFFESGILGFSLFMAAVIYFLVCAWRLMKNDDLPLWKRFLPVPALAVMVMDMAECLTIFANGHVPLTILYVFMGATVAFSEREHQNNAAPKASLSQNSASPALKENPLPYDKTQLVSFLQKAVVVLLCLWIAAYAFLFNRRQPLLLAAASALVFFAVPCRIAFRCLDGKPLVRNRRLLFACLGLFAILWVALGLNNSSIEIWREKMGGQDAPLWGHARIVRGDEWAVWTPMLFNQASEEWPAVNTSISAWPVDPALVSIGGLPARTLAALFKPFYWAFPLLGLETGYSLMTLLRFACLFAVSYACALQYTRKSKSLSLAAAFLISLSPYVQWWYSQSICEVLIFSQGMILCWMKVLAAPFFRERLGWGIFGAWCLGCFLMVLYPAWLVPTGFLTLAVIVWLTVRSRKTVKPAHLLQGLMPLLVLAVLMFFIARNSWDTLMRIKDSVYPGRRVYTGGDRPLQLFAGLLNLFFPVLGPSVSNASELSGFLSFAPAGVILTVVRFVRTKKKDPLSVILLVFIGVFGLLALVPWPAWLTKVTLLSQCVRPGMIISLCDLVLLLRALAAPEKGVKRKAGIALAVGGAIFSVGLTYGMLRPAVWWVPVLLVVAFGVLWLLFSGACRRLTAVTLCLFAVVAGCFVNPVQRGFAVVEELPSVSFVKSAALDPDTTVLAIEEEWPASNAMLFTGLKFFNSTQPFAAPERWAPVDPEGKWIEVYNRLGHVSLTVSEETNFEETSGDQIHAYLTLRDLKKLGVNTLLTRKEYPELRLITENEEWNLYAVE